MNRWFGQLLVSVILGGSAAHGEYTNTPTVLNGAGLRGTNGTYTIIASVAQPGGIQQTVGGLYVNRAGFFGGTLLNENLDTDSDGLCDELDIDNDGDTLSDLSELDGSAFGGWTTTSPNDSDTDGDGVSDAVEAAGGYNPNDPEHCLHIITSKTEGENFRLTWIGKGGGTVNTILQGTNLLTGITNVIHAAPYTGGSPPWYKTTNSTLVPRSAAVEFFSVQTPFVTP